MIDFSHLIGNGGPYTCNGDDCRAAVDHPGVCADCYGRIAAFKQDEALTAARESIPEGFRWATTESEDIAERVKCFSAKSDYRAAILRVASADVVLIYGASGEGKTTIACAALRHIIDAGRHPAGVAAHETGRRCRFLAARAPVARDGEDGITPLHVSRGASVLLLDDVGQEGGAGWKANDRSKAIADVLAERHDRAQRTIVTTFADEAAWRTLYGDGIARRYWDQSRVTVVRLTR